MRRRTWLLLAVMIVLCGLAVRLLRRPPAPLRYLPPEVVHTAPLQPVFPVAVELARLATVHESTTATGVVLPSSEETLLAPQAGLVKAVKVKTGARVEEDAVLAVIAEAEPSPSPSPSPRPGGTPAPDLVRLDAQVEMAQKDIEQAQGEVERAQAGLEKAQANEAAQLQVVEQDKKLLANGAIARNDYDADMQAAARAQALSSQAQDHVTQARQAVVQQRLTLEQAQSMRQTALSVAAHPVPTFVPMPPINLSDNNGAIKAGLPGMVMATFIKTGQKVKVKARLFRIGRLDMVRIRMHVASALVNDLKPGLAVQVTTPAVPYRLQAELKSVAPDGTLETLLANPGEKLSPGAVVKVQVPLGQHDAAVTVPASAVTEQDGRPVVWIAHHREDETVAIQVPVVPGIVDGDRLEILEGIQPGDEIIWKGTEALSNGVLVHSNQSDSGSEGLPGPVSTPDDGASSSASPSAEVSSSPADIVPTSSSASPKDTGGPE